MNHVHRHQEGAFAGAGLTPRHNRQHERNRQHIENKQAQDGPFKRRLHRHHRVFRLACRHGDHFNTQIAEDRNNGRKPHAADPKRHKPTAIGKIMQAVGWVGGEGQDPQADDDKSHDRQNLDRR